MCGEADTPVSWAPGHREIVRVRAPNPGPMTLSGTNSYVVGSDPAWVIDPGPADEAHVQRIREVADGRGGVGGVVLTHSHGDHNGGVEMFGEGLAFGNAEGSDDLAAMAAAAPVALPAPPTAWGQGGEGPMPVGPFEVLLTPGHAPDHVAFGFEDVCFCGDLVLGEGSAIVPPAAGGGSLVDYMRSLELIATRGSSLLCPGHGPWVTDPAAKIAEYLAHRRERERLLVVALDAGRRSTDDLLDAAWSDVPPPMRPAAALAMRAHLEKLDAEGRLPADLDW